MIGYRAPMFDEYLLPLGPPTNFSPPVYEKSKPVEGQVGYYTYLAPAGRSPAELFRNYKQEFQRLGIEVKYEKNSGQPGDFGSTFDKIDTDCDLAQILTYDGADERLMVGQSRDAKPSYYMVFVTAYNDGVIPERLQGRVGKGRALAQLVVISPDVLEKKMAFLNADDMKRSLHDSGEVAVYGLYFDTDKDAIKSESQSALAEIAKLLKSEPTLRLHIVGHTDNQGKPDYNLELSHRRASSVVAELANQVQYSNGSAYAFGGLPVADTITIGSRHDLGSGTSTGTATTTGDGSFPDTYSVCSTACPSTGETDAVQSWTVRGIPLAHSNSLVYKCSSISIDGY